MSTPTLPAKEESYTLVGQDVHKAGVRGMIVPAVTHIDWTEWFFWFHKVPGQRNPAKPLVELLATQGTVFIVKYSSGPKHRPMKVVNYNTGEITEVNQQSLHELIRQHGEEY